MRIPEFKIVEYGPKPGEMSVLDYEAGIRSIEACNAIKSCINNIIRFLNKLF